MFKIETTRARKKISPGWTWTKEMLPSYYGTVPTRCHKLLYNLQYIPDEFDIFSTSSPVLGIQSDSNFFRYDEPDIKNSFRIVFRSNNL